MARIRRIAALLPLAAAAALVVVALSPAASTARVNACDAYGSSSPTELTRQQGRKAIQCLVNVERDAAGLRPLKRNKKLQRAAQRHNERMVGTGCFAHECPGESALDGRLDLVGYLKGNLTRWMFGENIAWGARERGTPRSIVAAWMASPGHRANILYGTFRQIGVGFSVGTPSGDPVGGVYTTDFGFRVR
ncbi:MAG: CAP domain-containing protein [Solirubrobacterales bacterium]